MYNIPSLITVRKALSAFILTDTQLKSIQNFLLYYLKPIGVLEDFDLVFDDTLKFNNLINKFLDEHPVFKEELTKNSYLPTSISFDDPFSEDDYLSDEEIYFTELIKEMPVDDFEYFINWLLQLGFNAQLNIEKQPDGNELIEGLIEFQDGIIEIIQVFLNSESVTRHCDLVTLEELLPRGISIQKPLSQGYLTLFEYVTSKGFTPLNPELLNPQKFLFKNTKELQRCVDNFFSKQIVNTANRGIIEEFKKLDTIGYDHPRIQDGTFTSYTDLFNSDPWIEPTQDEIDDELDKFLNSVDDDLELC